MRFYKYHGLGNDFILVEDMDLFFNPQAELVRKLCHRRLGIGGDGLVLVRPSHIADLAMSIFNSDGSEAEMCGNAIRCFAIHARNRGLVPGGRLSIETLAGIKGATLGMSGGRAISAEIDMGVPTFRRNGIPMAGEGEFIMQAIRVQDREFTCCAVNTGVPHLVAFVEDITEEDILRYGAALEKYPLFPSRTNVNFARITGSGILLDTYERGCGRTLACGTGACAAAACAHRAGLGGREADILLAHGSLHISWREDGHIYMSGPGEKVYEGDFF